VRERYYAAWRLSERDCASTDANGIEGMGGGRKTGTERTEYREPAHHMKCSIVIRAYNEARHIRKLLLGISRQSLLPHEIILVDSGSTDDTVAIAREFGVRIVPIDKNQFTFGRALNVGCAASTGDILVFVSAHVYPTHMNWLAKLVEPFRDPKVALSYGKQRGNDLNHYSEHQIFAKWFPNESVSPQSTYFCNNANCAVRRSEWERRPYDETLTGLEDLDWAKKAQADGGWIAYVADAEIIHVHEESWATVRNRYRREALAMRRIDEKASFSILDFLMLLPANIGNDLWHALLEKRLLAEASSIFAFRYNQLLGTYRGYRGPNEMTDELRRRFYFPVSRQEKSGETKPPPHEEIDYEALLRNEPSFNFEHAKAESARQPRH